MSRIQPEEPSFDPARWGKDEPSERLARGIELFNAGEYEASHEEFEMLWLSTQGPDSDFFKGLVQASIALHHFQRGNLEGAAKLYAGHRRYLAAYLPAHLGIDVASFLRDMQAFLNPVVRPVAGKPAGFDTGRKPSLRPG